MRTVAWPVRNDRRFIVALGGACKIYMIYPWAFGRSQLAHFHSLLPRLQLRNALPYPWNVQGVRMEKDVCIKVLLPPTRKPATFAIHHRKRRTDARHNANEGSPVSLIRLLFGVVANIAGFIVVHGDLIGSRSLHFTVLHITSHRLSRPIMAAIKSSTN